MIQLQCSTRSPNLSSPRLKVLYSTRILFSVQTLKEEINEDTGNVDKKITEHALETLQPMLLVVGDDGEELASYYLPGNAYLNVEDGAKVTVGKTLAKLLKESVKTRDITGGLPRVGELFEARTPQESFCSCKDKRNCSSEGYCQG